MGSIGTRQSNRFAEGRLNKTAERHLWTFNIQRERPIKGFLTTHTSSPSNDHLLSCELLNAAEKTLDQND